MTSRNTRSAAGVQFPVYLRKLILFDKLISGMFMFITLLVGAGLLMAAARHEFGLGFSAGLALFAIMLALNM
jgi:hypothetical protein